MAHPIHLSPRLESLQLQLDSQVRVSHNEPEARPSLPLPLPVLGLPVCGCALLEQVPQQPVAELPLLALQLQGAGLLHLHAPQLRLLLPPPLLQLLQMCPLSPLLLSLLLTLLIQLLLFQGLGVTHTYTHTDSEQPQPNTHT